MKTFLVTGATGFIGGHLARTLVETGNRVVTICRDGNPPDGCAVVRGDIEDLQTCSRAIVEEELDGIFHLAAQPIVGYAKRDPYSTMETNIRGTYNLLEAFRRHRGKTTRLVVASSDKAYGELPVGSSAYTEDMPLAGRGPYDVSKSCTDLIAQSYGISYSLPIAVIRAGNVYGPGDDDMTRIIPSLCNDVLTRNPLTIMSDGSPVREYLHVDDVVRGYIAAYGGHVQCTARAYNLGSGDAVSVSDLVQEFYAMLQQIPRSQYYSIPRELVHEVDSYLKLIQSNPIQILGVRGGEIQMQILNGERSHKELGWTATKDRTSGMRETLVTAWKSRQDTQMQKPWSVVEDEELNLLRELEKTVASQGGVTPEVHAILGSLGTVRRSKRSKVG